MEFGSEAAHRDRPESVSASLIARVAEMPLPHRSGSGIFYYVPRCRDTFSNGAIRTGQCSLTRGSVVRRNQCAKVSSTMRA